MRRVLILLALAWGALWWEISGTPAAQPTATPLASPQVARMTPQASPGSSQEVGLNSPRSLRTEDLPPPPRPKAPNPPPPAPPVQARLPDPPAAPQVRPAPPPEPTYPIAARAAESPVTLDFLQEAHQSSSQLAKLVEQGRLQALFVGTGQAGAMVQLVLFNPGSREVTVHLSPGMVFRPPTGQAVQPLMVDEDVTMTIGPGSQEVRAVQTYCLDSRVPAPFPGQRVEYAFRDRSAESSAVTARVLQTSRDFDFTYPIYRQAVIQIALWKSMNQPVGDRQLVSVLGPDARNRQVRFQVLDDADRLLRAASK